MSFAAVSPLGVSSTNSGFLAAVDDDEEDDDDDDDLAGASLSDLVDVVVFFSSSFFSSFFSSSFFSTTVSFFSDELLDELDSFFTGASSLSEVFFSVDDASSLSFLSASGFSVFEASSTNSGFLAVVDDEEEDDVDDDDLAAEASSLSEAFVVDVEDDFAGASPSEVFVDVVEVVDLAGASPSDVLVVVDLTGACIKFRNRRKHGQIHISYF